MAPAKRSASLDRMAATSTSTPATWSAPTTAVAIERLEKVYGSGPAATRALDGVDLAFRRGEFVAIMGPSGSGKSTLLHIVGALETPTGGHVAIAGKRLDGIERRAS